MNSEGNQGLNSNDHLKAFLKNKGRGLVRMFVSTYLPSDNDKSMAKKN